MLKKVKKAIKSFLDSNPELRDVFDENVFLTREYRTLPYMNTIMNALDGMEKELKYDPFDGDELYIHLRFQAAAFLKDLMEKIADNVPEGH